MSYAPPSALTGKGWNYFDREFKQNAPIRYYLDRTFPRKFIYPVKWKIAAIRAWFRYRIIDVYHTLKTGLEPGYYLPGTQMLHVNFNLLKDFVEVEVSYNSLAWNETHKSTWCEKHMPFYRAFRPFRNPQPGIEHLEWASTLDDPALPPLEQSVRQAQNAREVLFLYRWWVIDRPARQEIPHLRRRNADDDSIFSMFDTEDDDEDQKTFNLARFENMEARSKQTEEWAVEDTEMLVRLMKVRDGMWT